MIDTTLKVTLTVGALIAIGSLSPAVIGEAEFDPDPFVYHLVVAHFEGETFVAYQAWRTDDVLVRWESTPQDSEVIARAPVGFEVEGVWADSRGGAAAVLVAFKDVESGARELRVLRVGTDGWVASESDLVDARVTDFAMSPDGTGYVLTTGTDLETGRATILRERSGTWSTEATLFPFIALGESLAVDASGMPYVCYGQLGEVALWRGDGEKSTVYRGSGLGSYACSVHMADDGSALAATYAVPLFGESGCGDPDPMCAETRRTWTLHRRGADGAWSAYATGAPAWIYGRFVETDSGEHYFYTDSRASGLFSYTVTDSGLTQVNEIDAYAWDAARWPGGAPRYAYYESWRVGIVSE